VSPSARSYLLAVAGLIAGAVVCVVLAGATVATLDVTGPLASTEVTVTASDLVPFARPAGFIALAAVVALYATGRIGRRLIGLVLIAVGAVVIVTVVVRAVDLAESATAWAGESSAVDGTVVDAGTSPWPLIGLALGGAVIAVVGAWSTARGAQWPTMGRRYERAAAGPASNRGSARRAGAREAWDALDRGEDPTA
jgi:uncharacterized membrane protein (TIGR02234 family)